MLISSVIFLVSSFVFHYCLFYTWNFNSNVSPEYTDCISAEDKTLPTSFLNHLMVSLQSLNFKKYGIRLHCLCLQVYTNPEWYHHIGQIEPLDHFDCAQTNDCVIELLVIYNNNWNNLPVCK